MADRVADWLVAAQTDARYTDPRLMSSAELLPEDVRRLIEQHVDTFEKLAIIEHLRAHASQAWSEESLGRQLHFDAELTAETLAELAKSRLVRRSGGKAPSYDFAPDTPELAAAVEALAQVLIEQRAMVINELAANAMRRIRGQIPRAFADAFRFRDPGDEGGKHG
jgi:hypothetical protein